jgi:hypothetical protein
MLGHRREICVGAGMAGIERRLIVQHGFQRRRSRLDIEFVEEFSQECVILVGIAAPDIPISRSNRTAPV